MQNIDLICVGKLNASYFAEGVAEYQKRLGGFCRFRILELPEAPLPDKNVNQAQIDKALEKEGKAILAAVRKGACLVALCVEGKPISSEELAAMIARRAGSGAGIWLLWLALRMVCHLPSKRPRKQKFRLGRITLPHQLARLVLVEQLYRACTINAGMKYHK